MAAAEATAALTPPTTAGQAVRDYLGKATSMTESRAHGTLLAVEALLAVRSATFAPEDVDLRVQAEAIRFAFTARSPPAWSTADRIVRLLSGGFQRPVDDLNSGTVSTDGSGAAIEEQTGFVDLSNPAQAWKQMHGEYLGTASVPKQERLLPILGRLAANLSEADIVQEIIELAITKAHPEQSVESRMAAAQCLRYLVPVTTEEDEGWGLIRISCFGLLRTLLQDDDNDVRLLASDIVSVDMAKKASASQSRAMAYWISWAKSMGEEEAVIWERSLWNHLALSSRICKCSRTAFTLVVQLAEWNAHAMQRKSVKEAVRPKTSSPSSQPICSSRITPTSS